MESWLAANIALSTVEAAAYGATAVVVWRAGGSRRRRWFAGWWATACLGMVLALMLMASRWMGSDSLALVKLNIGLTLLISGLGVILLVPFLWFLWRGTDRGWIAAPLVAIVSGVAAASVWMASANVEHTFYATLLRYEDGAPSGIFLQSFASLLVIVVAAALLRAKDEMDPQAMRRLRLVAIAVLLFYVSKAIAGGILSTGFSAPALVATRVMGVAAAGIAFWVYLREGTLDAGRPRSSEMRQEVTRKPPVQ